MMSLFLVVIIVPAVAVISDEVANPDGTPHEPMQNGASDIVLD